jgi:hypothetical protein
MRSTGWGPAVTLRKEYGGQPALATLPLECHLQVKGSSNSAGENGENDDRTDQRITPHQTHFRSARVPFNGKGAIAVEIKVMQAQRDRFRDGPQFR